MINIRLKNAAQAIADVRGRKLWLYNRTKELIKRLSDLGLTTATAYLQNGLAVYDGLGDAHIQVEQKTPHSFKIIADGHDVCFLEFGAGVYFNPSEPYPIPRPAEIAGIGEYGLGNGKKQGWFYLDENNETKFSRGNPAIKFMYNSAEEMRQNIERIAREVFRIGK